MGKDRHETEGASDPGLEVPQPIFLQEKGYDQGRAGLKNFQACDLKMKKPPQQQTYEEWRDDYDAASGDDEIPRRAPASDAKPRQTESRKSAAWRKSQGMPGDIPPGNRLIGEFSYRYHNTTPNGRLVLKFEHVETRTYVSMFFNVLVESQKTGKKYPARKGGQFTYSEGHNIHGFLTNMLGASPSRPSRAHHELHKLKHMKFVGVAIAKKPKTVTKGPYLELTELDRVPE